MFSLHLVKWKQKTSLSLRLGASFAKEKAHLWSRGWEGNQSSPERGPLCSSCPRCRPESKGWAAAGRWSRKRCGWWISQTGCGWSGRRASGAPESSRQTAAAKVWPRSGRWLSSDRCVCDGSSPSLRTKRCWGTADSWIEPQTVGKRKQKYLDVILQKQPNIWRW